MNKKLAISLLFALILCTCTALAQNDWRALTAQSAVNQPKSSRLKAHVDFLCDSLRQGRRLGSKGHSDASFYIAGVLESFGCKPLDGCWGQSFSVKDNPHTGHNIVGMFSPGGNEDSRRYIIVAAHYDALGTIKGVLYPGADANASGVAAMLETARAVEAHSRLFGGYSSKIIFAAFDAYTDGRAGSAHFVEMLKHGMLRDPFSGRTIEMEDIAMMIDLDQMGSTLSPVRKDQPNFIIAIGENQLETNLMRTTLNRCNIHYNTGLEIYRNYYGSERFTEVFYKLGDRGHFIAENIPTVYFTSGITDTTNKSSDTSESLDYGILEARATLIFRFIEKSF